MKYSNEVVIDQKRDEVIELFDNTDNMKYWQKGLVSAELVSDERGKTGAKTKTKYEMDKRSVEMIEK